MEPFELTLSHYRCFPSDLPATIEIRPGVTAIVGPNNSGKTALLRSVFELRQLWERGWIAKIAPVTLNQVASAGDSTDLVNTTSPGTASVRVALYGQTDSDRAPSPSPSLTHHLMLGEPNESVLLCQSFLNDKAISTPTLLGRDQEHLDRLSVCQSILQSSMYVPAERHAIQVGGGAKHFDVLIGPAFVKQWNDLKNSGDKKKARLALRVETDLSRLLGLQSIDVAVSPTSPQLICHVDKHTYRLEELGHGLQQMLIVLTTAAAMAPDFLLYEEPETGLHPTLQTDYITTLGSYAKQGVIFTTHNLGLARAVADQIYCVIPQGRGRSRVCRYQHGDPNIVEFAGSLHYGVYGLSGDALILLVEGPTDLRVITAFMERLGLPKRILAMHLGGNTTINDKNATLQLKNVSTLAKHVLAIVDSERAEADALPAENVQEFQQACNRAGVQCHVTERRCIESYFPQSAIERAFNSSARALGPFEKLDSRTHGWPKKNGYRAVSHMTKEEIAATDIGKRLIEFAKHSSA